MKGAAMAERPTAEILAGGQYAEGRLYYLFLKPEFVGQYSGSAGATSSRTAGAPY
jgi:hypothetical protein